MTARLRQSPNLTMCTKTTEVLLNNWVPNLESELCRPHQMSSSCPSACVAIWWICSAIKDLVTVSGQPVIFGRSAALCNSAVQPDDRGGQPWWWSATVNDDDDRDNDVMLGVMVKMMICQCQRVTNLRWKEKIRINLRPQYKASLDLSLTNKKLQPNYWTTSGIDESGLSTSAFGVEAAGRWERRFFGDKMLWKLSRGTEVFFLLDVFMWVSRCQEWWFVEE